MERNVTKSIPYVKVDEEDAWKIKAVIDLTEAQYDREILPNFTTTEIDDIRQYIATC